MFHTVKTGEIGIDILTEAGVLPADPDQPGKNMASEAPNSDNLIFVEYDGQEMVFASDGMPLLGTFPNSYDHAPAEYARRYSFYPRNDSPSRLSASEHGARVNEGASEHLDVMFGDTVAILRSLAVARRTIFEGTYEEERDLTTQESLDILNGAVSMWSYMTYRKDGSVPRGGVPAEVGLLHRSMSGVRMSLLSLFMHDEPHFFRKEKGWSDRSFSAGTWASAVEESKKLIGVDDDPRQICPAPSPMIRRVLETVVERPKGVRSADLEAQYATNPQTLLRYGRAWYELELARGSRTRYIDQQARLIRSEFDGQPVTRDDLYVIKSIHLPRLRKKARYFDERERIALAEALSLLGYSPESAD